MMREREQSLASAVFPAVRSALTSFPAAGYSRNVMTFALGGLTRRRQALELAMFVLVLFQLCAPLHAQDPKKVRMAYSVFSISFLTIFVARDDGLFKKHGLETEWIQMTGPLPVAPLAAGEIDDLTGYTIGIVVTRQAVRSRGS